MTKVSQKTEKKRTDVKQGIYAFFRNRKHYLWRSIFLL